jgi:hypothetical protein
MNRWKALNLSFRQFDPRIGGALLDGGTPWGWPLIESIPWATMSIASLVDIETTENWQTFRNRSTKYVTSSSAICDGQRNK